MKGKDFLAPERSNHSGSGPSECDYSDDMEDDDNYKNDDQNNWL